MTTPFADLPDDAQVAVLRDVAAEAAMAFGLADAVVTPVLHAYNATFRLDVDGASFAMRILVGSSSTPEHVASWSPPPGAALPIYDDVLSGATDAIARVDDLPAAARRVLAEARTRSQDALDRLHATGVVRPLHADLHSGNVRRSATGLQILGFDDAGLGVPALDLALSRFSADSPEVQDAIGEGYAAVAALPDASEADLHALAAGRQLLLANDLLTTTSASLRVEARASLARAVRRLEAWLDTGAFSRSSA